LVSLIRTYFSVDKRGPEDADHSLSLVHWLVSTRKWFCVRSFILSIRSHEKVKEGYERTPTERVDSDKRGLFHPFAHGKLSRSSSWTKQELNRRSGFPRVGEAEARPRGTRLGWPQRVSGKKERIRKRLLIGSHQFRNIGWRRRIKVSDWTVSSRSEVRMRNEWEAHRLHSKLEKQEEDQSVEESYQASRGGRPSHSP